MAAPNSWSRRLTGNLGQRLQRWGAALTAWAGTVPATGADNAAIDAAKPNEPPAHWQALLQGREGSLQWFGRNSSDPGRPPAPPPTAQPPVQPPTEATRMAQPTYPGVPRRAPIPTVRFEPWPEATLPAVKFESPPRRPAPATAPGYTPPASPPPIGAPDYETPQAAPPPASWPIIQPTPPGAPPPAPWPALQPTPSAAPTPDYPSRLPTPPKPESAAQLANTTPPGAPRRAVIEPPSGGELATALPPDPAYVAPAEPATAAAAYAPWPERNPTTRPMYAGPTTNTPTPAPTYPPAMPRPTTGLREPIWPARPMPKPDQSGAPVTSPQATRRASETSAVWPEPPVGRVEMVWDALLEAGGRWPELPAFDSADNEAPRLPDPHWEEFRREQDGARLRRGL